MTQPGTTFTHPITSLSPSQQLPSDCGPHVPMPLPPTPHISSLEPSLLNTNNTVVLQNPLHNHGDLRYRETKAPTSAEVTRRDILIAPCRCRSWHCPKCHERKAELFRQKCLPILHTFRDILLLTLTIDRKCFTDPQSAFLYLRDNRCIGELMRKLKDSTNPDIRIHSDRYLKVLEWQADGWPHYHVVVEASYISHEALTTYWNSLSPCASPMGHVYVSSRHQNQHMGNPETALRYLTKWENPVPEWLLDMKITVRKYEASRSFFKNTRDIRPAPPKRAPSGIRATRSPSKTIRERLEDCGTTSVFLQVQSPSNSNAQPISRPQYTHLGSTNIPPELLYYAVNKYREKWTRSPAEFTDYRLTPEMLTSIIAYSASLMDHPVEVFRATPAFMQLLQESGILLEAECEAPNEANQLPTSSGAINVSRESC
jgi:hypothetical protein